MATVTAVVDQISAVGTNLLMGELRSADNNKLIDRVTWTAITTTNQDGTPLLVGQDVVAIMFQCAGTDGTGGLLTIQGTLDGTNWFTCVDESNTAISMNAGDAVGLLRLPVYVRPMNTAGDGSTTQNVTATIWYR